MNRSTWVPGRDQRAVAHPGGPGTRRLGSRHLESDHGGSHQGVAHRGGSRHVVVAGGGIAGLAAAVGLVERGVEVTLVEKQEQLGGRVRSWPLDSDPTDSDPTDSGPADSGPPRTMSRGFHAFFRQYYNLRGLLRRVDPGLAGLTPLADYPLVLAEGHTDSFARIPRTPPLNLATFVATSPSFTASDLTRVDIAAALELLDVDFPGTFSAYDGESAAQFLDRLHFPDAARHLALEVFARSFFAHPAEFSAGELVAMFHSYFVGSSEGLLFDVPVDDYDTTFWAPLGRYLQAHGARVRTNEIVEEVSLVERGAPVEKDGVHVRLGSGEVLTADALVLATDPATTRRLVAQTAGLGNEGWRDRIAQTRNAPPFGVWRVWLDRFVDAERAAFLGTSGYGPLDNITVLERFEDGARRWSQAHRGSVVELHAYALPDAASAAEVDRAVVTAALWTELTRVYPEVSGAHVVAQEWIVADDCPLVGTGPWLRRPGVTTPDPRVLLAGDQIRCDYPVALMERAATTGLLAANTLLADWGVEGHDLWTVPMRSRQPAFGRARALLARRAAARI